MEKITWIIDETLDESRYETGYPSIADAAEQLGHRVVRTKYKSFSEQPELSYIPLRKDCVVCYGTIEFCRQMERYSSKVWTPGMYFNANVKNWSKFAPYIGTDLLNESYCILPYGEVVRRAVRWTRGTPLSWFIKPESGLKEFTGQVITAVSLDEDLKKLSPHHEIDPTTLCVCAPPKVIKAEFRYVIVNKTVVAGSEYRWDNVLDVRRDTSPFTDYLAVKIAEADWQADSVYVCDIALLEDDTPKVIELNAFSSSGLYACDTVAIVKAVSKAALREHSGELS